MELPFFDREKLFQCAIKGELQAISEGGGRGEQGAGSFSGTANPILVEFETFSSTCLDLGNGFWKYRIIAPPSPP